MPYIVTFDKNYGIISVVFAGAATINDHYAARDEALQLSKKYEGSQLLVDLSKLNTSHLSTMECFGFAHSVARLFPHVRIAQVIPIEAKSRKDCKFMNTVAVNRGATAMEFQTIQEARKWLLE